MGVGLTKLGCSCSCVLLSSRFLFFSLSFLLKRPIFNVIRSMFLVVLVTDQIRMKDTRFSSMNACSADGSCTRVYHAQVNKSDNLWGMM